MPKTILAQQEHSLTADTKLVVSHGTWRKKDYVDVRVHWRSPEDKWFPTKKGVRLDTGLAHQITVNIREMLGISITEAPKNGNGKRPVRKNGHKRDSTGLPGPAPPRNAAGGFQVKSIGAYKTHSFLLSGIAGIGKDACDPYDFKPAVFIPPWVKYVVPLARNT